MKDSCSCRMHTWPWSKKAQAWGFFFLFVLDLCSSQRNKTQIGCRLSCGSLFWFLFFLTISKGRDRKEFGSPKSWDRNVCGHSLYLLLISRGGVSGWGNWACITWDLTFLCLSPRFLDGDLIWHGRSILTQKFVFRPRKAFVAFWEFQGNLM